jgi:hypothetical protein
LRIDHLLVDKSKETGFNDIAGKQQLILFSGCDGHFVLEVAVDAAVVAAAAAAANVSASRDCNRIMIQAG